VVRGSVREENKVANENEKKQAAKKGGESKRKKGSGESAQGIRLAAAGETKVSASTAPRLETIYKKEVLPALMKQFNEKNPMAIPRLSKIVINCAIKDAVANPKVLDNALDELMTITGQKPVLTRARKAIATFKVREGNAVGVMVTLRRARMYEFLDRMVNVALPRVRDFKGVSSKSFDGRGNYSLGLREQIIFPEINYDKVDKIRGMTVTITTTATNNEKARALLAELGMPFKK
jgi:large subunit ribosomal protein L5